MWQPAPKFYVLDHSDGWELANKVGYTSQHGFYCEIPEGFKTDFASIPRLVRWLIPVNGKHRLAALLHDYLYATYVKDGRMPRSHADEYFLAEMGRLRVKVYKAVPMYWAVRLFGRAHV